MAYIHITDQIVSELIYEAKNNINYANQYCKSKKLGEFIMGYAQLISSRKILNFIEEYKKRNDIKYSNDNEIEINKTNNNYEETMKWVRDIYYNIANCEI
jgi:hypothetical protein